MTQTYQLTGMTCGSCEAKVKTALESLNEVSSASVSKESNSAIINMDGQVALSEFQKILDAKYHISLIKSDVIEETERTWLETYKPILLIFFYISIVSLLIQFKNGTFQWMEVMQHFMAGFFLVFSFFKFLNLKAFADSYKMYDVVAKKIPLWGYGYAIIEFGLGIAYLINFNPLITNAVAFVVMSVSIIGVLQSVMNKEKIQCACLGSVFNLPMSTVTIIEDALMIIMSGMMLYALV